MVERRSIEERVGSALARGDLRQREGPCALDKVGALGMVGVTERLADAVFRLKYANDHHGYHEALAGVYSIARSLDAKNGWRLKRKTLHWMSKRVLHYWLSDVCPLCSGVGYEVIAGSPHLSDRPCQQCHGARKRPMPWLKRLPRKPEGRRVSKVQERRWEAVCRKLSLHIERHRTLLVALERVEWTIGEKMIQKLSDAVRIKGIERTLVTINTQRPR